jgi:hypothetical protein
VSPDPVQAEPRAPRVLFIYYTYTQQTLKVVEAMTGVFHQRAKGGSYVDGAHWAFAGGQIKSLLSLLSYLGKGENRGKYLGVKIPPTNLQSGDLEQAQAFANRLADQVAIGQPA